MRTINRSLGTVLIVGCGGVASYLLPALLRTFSIDTVTLMDGDTLEPRNLDRQLFTEEQIGMNKAEALADLLRKQGFDKKSEIEVVPEYFSRNTYFTSQPSVVICCVDNHAARSAILWAADEHMFDVVFAGNEYTSSQGMIYLPAWKGTKLDPRVRYPEIDIDHTGDPLRPEGCQGPNQERNSQLAMANFGAANYALWLLWYWFAEMNERNAMNIPEYSPVEHFNNFSKFRTSTVTTINTL